MAVIVGINSYVAIADADSYLAQSQRAAETWSGMSASEKELALVTAWRSIERARYRGDRTPVRRVTAIAIAAGGASYVAGDVLTIAGGTGRAATVEVLTVSTGAVATVQLLDAGDYTADPTTPNSPTGGSGTGCSLTLTIATQTSRWPRTGVTDAEGDAVDSALVPEQVKQAQIELSYELVADAAVETARDQNSNIQQIGAGGGVGITYFKPQESNGKFPVIVQELLAEFLDPGAVVTGLATTGTDQTNFPDCEFDLTEGAP